MDNKAIVVGTGIVAVATSLALLKRNYSVTMLERTNNPAGASVRNFGMIWPVGQANGPHLEIAMKSRQLWYELSQQAKFSLNPNGSLHLAYAPDEMGVLMEFYEKEKPLRSIQWLSPAQIGQLSPGANKSKLLGGLYSADESIVDPREAIAQLLLLLQSHERCTIHYNAPVISIQEDTCLGTNNQVWKADKIFICTGGDMNILFPDLFDEKGLLCELQMMRTGRQPGLFVLGPSLCAGLTLIHYKAFKDLSGLPALKNRLEQEHPHLLRNGVHVMAAQNSYGEVTIGDSHRYGSLNDPFIDQSINEDIIHYLKSFCLLPDMNIRSFWKGIYLKSKNNEAYCIEAINPHCHWINCFGGAGMTLALGALEVEIDHLI